MTQLALFNSPIAQPRRQRRELVTLYAAILFLRRKKMRVYRAGPGRHLVNGQSWTAGEILTVVERMRRPK